jgi:regulatory protein RepA
VIDLERHAANGSANAHRSEDAPASEAEPWSSRVVATGVDWYTKPPPRRTWLLRDRRTNAGVLPVGKVGQIVAEGGAGKTTALMQLALSVATGTPFLGTLDVASPGRVLAVFGEEDAEEVRRKSFNAARTANAPIPSAGSIVTLPLAGVPSEMVVRDAFGNPSDGPFLLWLRRFLASDGDGWRLILVDPLSRFAGLDAERDNALGTRFIEALESLAVQTGATVLCAHHSNQASRGAGSKMSATSARGVTALTDGVRWQACMAVEQVGGLDAEAGQRLGELVTVAFTKSNYSRRGEPIVCRRDQEHGGALIPIDDADAQLVVEAQRANNARAVRQNERDAIRAGRGQREDRAAESIVRSQPGIGARDLRGRLMAELSIGRSAADDAITRAVGSGRMRREGDRHSGFRHFIDEVTQ